MTRHAIADRRARHARCGCSRSRPAVAAAASPPPSAPPPGPPFPAPEVDRAVYDYAGILSPEAIAKAEADDRRDRGADGRRGRRLHPGQRRRFPTTEETEAKARALMDQWGVGRNGLQRRAGHLLRHAAEPRARPGPAVRRPGLRGGVPVERGAPVDLRERHAAATSRPATSTARSPPRSRRSTPRRRPSTPHALERSRQVNAVVGLVGAPVVFLGLSGWALFNWRRFGKDPVYLDDPSVLMPAPPPDLTAASGAMIMDGATSRRALTTAMLDLASRGLHRVPGRAAACCSAGHKVGIDVGAGRRRRRDRGPTPAQPATPDGPGRGGRAHASSQALGRRRGRVHQPGRPAQVRVARRRIRYARSRITSSIAAGSARSRARSSRAGPAGARSRSSAGVIALIAGLNIPISGLTLLGGGRDRGRHRGPHHRPVDAGGDDRRRDDPGDARRLPADAPEDDGAGSLDAAGRRRGRPGLARHARPGRRVGDRARAPGRDRGRPLAQPRGRQGGPDQRRRALLPGLVPDVERDAVHELGRRRQRRRACSPTRASRTSAG